MIHSHLFNEQSKIHEPHRDRCQQILREYPEIKKLFGPDSTTAVYVVVFALAQIFMSYLMADKPIWIGIIAAVFVGAFIDHGLWALIHDLTHNLVFKKPKWNAWLQIFANIPHVFPSSIAFRRYHILHHQFQGDLEYDADLPSALEIRFASNSSLRKALWLLFYFAFQSYRVTTLKKVKTFDWMTVTNTVIVLGANAVFVWLWGLNALIYLLVSSILAVGLHPVGARWIQEHFLTSSGQETFSYYGILNIPSFNVGYHNEHHDFIFVPWSRLPAVKKMAPKYYETLTYHRSWTLLLLRFIFDPTLSLRSRCVRNYEKIEKRQSVKKMSPYRQTPSLGF